MLGGTAAAVALMIVAYVVTRPDAYAPPLPTAREIALRQQAIEHAPHGPPPGLVEANKSVETGQ